MKLKKQNTRVTKIRKTGLENKDGRGEGDSGAHVYLSIISRVK